LENSGQSVESVYARYQLTKYHQVSERIAKTKSPSSIPEGDSSVTNLSREVSVSSHAIRNFFPEEMVVPNNSSVRAEPSQATKKKQGHTHDIAIVGIAGRYPKAKNLRELWENLSEGRDCIEEFPADRYQWRLQHGSFEKYRGG